MAFGNFTACVGFDKNIFQVKIMDRMINIFSWAIVLTFPSGSYYHRNSHIDGVRMC
jgi:hypothetical protein